MMFAAIEARLQWTPVRRGRRSGGLVSASQSSASASTLTTAFARLVNATSVAFFLERRFQQGCGIWHAQFLSPGPERSVTRHLVTLDGLRRGGKSALISIW